MTFTFFSDPGHGWLRVDIQSVKSVGLDKHSFTLFSYEHSHWLYLEEDCDAGTFIRAYEAKHGHRPPIRYKNSNNPSPIRGYNRISVKEVA